MVLSLLISRRRAWAAAGVLSGKKEIFEDEKRG
jgi:hypothetical protein